MINYNITPFTGHIDNPARLKQMALVKAPLKTKYDGKLGNLRTHILEFLRRMQNTGLYHEFEIRTKELPRPAEIDEDVWTYDHPLRWERVNFLENFNGITFDMLQQERERIDDTLAMLDEAPQAAQDDGAKELASKQHSMWIAELLDNSWSDSVTTEMNAFEEETKGDGILQWYVFLGENMGQTKEAIIAVEQQLTKEKFALDNFNFNIQKFTTHVRTYIRQIMSAGLQPTSQHFILIFSALKEVEQDEFKLTIMKLYENWRTGQGDGADFTILKLLARADSEYKRIKMLGQWTTKNKESELLGLQAKFDVMQSQLKALVTENKQIKEQLKTSTNKPDDAPKPEENETRTVDGQTWLYCKQHCFIGRHWNKTHKSAEHKRGLGKNKKKEKQDTANLSEYDINMTGDTDFQSG
jgi:hypothetical protein